MTQTTNRQRDGRRYVYYKSDRGGEYRTRLDLDEEKRRLTILAEEHRPYSARQRTEEAQQRRAAREMEASLPDSSPTGDPIV